MTEFELVLLSADPNLIDLATAAGVDGALIDWEFRGKKERQSQADTQINSHTLKDLEIARTVCRKNLICRINAYSDQTRQEVELAIGAGANEILLPMVETAREVERVLEYARGRAGVGILIETLEAVKTARDLGALPLSRVFVGLNDLSIQRKITNIFLPLVDGTIETIRSDFRVPFGFGGVTLPGKGFPIPCALLIEEMVRLKCSFSFMRRSFLKDVEGLDLSYEIPRLKDWIREIASGPLGTREMFVRMVSAL